MNNPDQGYVAQATSTAVADPKDSNGLPMVEAAPARRKSFGNIPALDGIRAVAIILVLIAHAGLDKLVPGGLGVTIFFFLSGYLITTLMRAELGHTGTLHIKKFYIRRALRIFPPLYITLTLVLAYVLVRMPQFHVDWGGLVMQFVHLANYEGVLGRDDGVPNMPLWSLAVEEHFYLIFPLCYIYFARRNDGRQQAKLLLRFCAAALVIRILMVAVLPDYHDVYSWSHTRFDSILFGSILAVWSNPVMDADEQSYVPTTIQFILAMVLLFICLLIRSEIFRQTLRYSLQGIALFVIFSYIIRLKSGFIYSVLVNKPMKIIGVLSYTIYLVNFFIFNAVHALDDHLTPQQHVIRSLIGLVLTFAYAGLMYVIIERPIARMRARMH